MQGSRMRMNTSKLILNHDSYSKPLSLDFDSGIPSLLHAVGPPQVGNTPIGKLAERTSDYESP